MWRKSWEVLSIREDMVDQVHELKGTVIVVFKRAGFELHRWNSNVPELEADNQFTEDSQTYAKEQLEG